MRTLSDSDRTGYLSEAYKEFLIAADGVNVTAERGLFKQPPADERKLQQKIAQFTTFHQAKTFAKCFQYPVIRMIEEQVGSLGKSQTKYELDNETDSQQNQSGDQLRTEYQRCQDG